MMTKGNEPPRLDCVLFDDYVRTDYSTRAHKETLYQFYNRSSWTQYAIVRQTLQHMVDQLPAQSAREIVRRMVRRDDKSFLGAYFELFMFDLLGRVCKGAEKDPSIEGKTPDFRARDVLADGSPWIYYVELTNIGGDPALTPKAEDAVERLDRVESDDFQIDVRVRGNPSRDFGKRVTLPFRDLVSTGILGRRTRFIDDDSDFEIEGTLVHRVSSPSGDGITCSQDQGFVRDRIVISMGDEKPRLQSRLKDKAYQYRGLSPLLIAVRADLHTLTKWENYEDVLFGYSVSEHAPPRPPRKLPRETNGFWSNGHNSHVIGVVIFPELYPHGQEQEVTYRFYANPNRSPDHPLPKWCRRIQHYDSWDVT